MYEDGNDDNETEEERERLELQPVSIRKKLIEPNNILPAAMIRSHPPKHILPIPPEHASRPGHRMPLDPHPEQDSDSPTAPSSRRLLSPHSKHRSKTQLPEFKRKEQFRLNNDQGKLDEADADLLQFLNGSIRGLLECAQRVCFISSSAFLSNVKGDKYRPRPNASLQERRENSVEYLKGTRHFAATSYAFDQLASLDQPRAQSLNFDEHLEFSDDFESSNLFLASSCDAELMNTYRKIDENHQGLYLLSVRLDYNTRSYGQWFYFKVKRRGGIQRTVSYKFMIINMTKNSSLFGRGLKVSVCRNGLWGKEGSNIRYYRNSLRRQEAIITQNDTFAVQYYHTLQFTLQLASGEEIYVSYNEPYSYSRVGRLLDKMSTRYQQNQHNIINFKRTELCTTYLNNTVQVLTLSARRIAHPLHLSIDDKKVIFIMARTHPIETAGSHVVEGILNEIYRLFIDNPREQHRSHLLYRLLEQYILKVIPMANPDGVILGNSRCNLAGYDLNRCWKGPKFERSKEVYYIKRHIFLYHRRVEMFLDLHAHSKKKNVFAYGCHDTSDPFSSREFPFLLSKLSRNDFLFQECRFTRLDPKNGQKKTSKDGTARIFLYDSLRIPNIFTIEHSYCSARNSAFHYDRHAYALIGADILTAISLYFSPNFKAEYQGREEERNRTVNQNHIKISLNTSVTSDLELKFTINSQKPRSGTAPIEEELTKCKDPKELREHYLFELRQREENIKVGLQRDNEVSESQEEERIYEANPKKREKTKNNSEAGFKKTKGESKTDRLLQYITKNTEKVATQKTSNKQSILNVSHISSTHSETNLARITKVNKDRFRTMTKNEELVLIPDEICHQNYIKDKRNLLTRKQRPPTQLQSSRKGKHDNCLSIVEIGLNNEVQERQLQQRIMVIDRFEAKQRLKTFHGFRDQRAHTETKQEAVRRQEQKDDEIKQYLRRIMKPKQLVDSNKGKRERVVRLQEVDRKQNHVQFTDLRMSKLVILQNHKQFRLNHQKSLH